MARDPLLGLDGIQTIEVSGMNQHSRIRPGLSGRDRSGGPLGLNHLLNGQPVALRKATVPLVMGRDSHHGAGAVIHQHIVSDPHRQWTAVEWIEDCGAGEDPTLGSVITGALQGTEPCHLCLEGLHNILLIRGRQTVHQRVVRGEHHVAGTSQGVWPCGEHRDGGV